MQILLKLFFCGVITATTVTVTIVLVVSIENKTVSLFVNSICESNSDFRVIYILSAFD